MSSICTVVNSNCIHDCVGLVLSTYIHMKDTPLVIVCDTIAMQCLKKFIPWRNNVKFFPELDKYSGKNRNQMEKDGTWTEFQMFKAVAMKRALDLYDDTLFLDSDMLVTAPFEIEKIKGDAVLGVSPHYIRKEFTDPHGYYNGGMLWTSSKEVPDAWIEASKTSRFYDQACIEDLAKQFNHFEFDDSYNISWWRLSQGIHGDEKERFGPNFTYSGKTIKSIHTHFGDAYHNYFNIHVAQKLHDAGRYKDLAIIERIANEAWVLLVPQQPRPGFHHHVNDSFRELAIDTPNHYDDVKTLPVNANIPRLGMHICLYDRDTGEWIGDEVTESLKIFVGNMNTDSLGDKYSPWIYWARRPTITDKEHSYKKWTKTIDSIFMGNIENSVQAKHRSDKWKDCVSEFHLTNGKIHKFSHREYIKKLASARYGLCMKGFGEKCHREMECMAVGTVPLCIGDIPMHSFLDPPEEGKHFFRVHTPEDVTNVIKNTPNNKYEEMSKACMEWYNKNVYVKNWFHTFIRNVLKN